jgi:hypothetical protein
VKFTVVQGTPSFEIDILDQPPTVCVEGGTCSINFVAGSNFLVHVILRAPNTNVPPTGTVTVSLGTLTQTLPLVADSYINAVLSTANATLNNVPAGTYSLSVSYSGDSNWSATSYADPQPLSFVANSAVATSTTTLRTSTSSVDSADSVMFNVTVTASTDQYGTPVGIVSLMGNGTLFAQGVLGSGGIVTVSQTETTTIVVPATEMPVGQISAVAVYSGTAGVASSVSAPVQLNVTATDFTFSTGAPSLSVKSGQSGTVPLLLGAPYGIGVPVSLACAPSSSLFTCSVNPASSTVNGSGTVALNVAATASSTTAKLSSEPRRDSSHWFVATCSFTFALSALLILPCSRRKWRVQAITLVLAFLVVVTSCGGGSSSAPPPPNSNPTPPGTNSVLATATANGVVHNAQMTVLVLPQ